MWAVSMTPRLFVSVTVDQLQCIIIISIFINQDKSNLNKTSHYIKDAMPTPFYVAASIWPYRFSFSLLRDSLLFDSWRMIDNGSAIFAWTHLTNFTYGSVTDCSVIKIGLCSCIQFQVEKKTGEKRGKRVGEQRV
jgi:hypothetical protein